VIFPQVPPAHGIFFSAIPIKQAIMKTTKKTDKKSKGKNPAIGEGNANSATSAVQNELEIRRTGYPKPGTQDQQYDNQPEFIDEDNDPKEKD
jgi:hypothetical protein